jgi:hypothetical protein
MVDRWT